MVFGALSILDLVVLGLAGCRCDLRGGLSKMCLGFDFLVADLLWFATICCLWWLVFLIVVVICGF